MRVVLITLGLVTALLLGACSSSSKEEVGDEPGEVPAATDEAEGAQRSVSADEDAPAETATPEPTATPVPSPTPQPTRTVPDPDSGGESTGSLEDADIVIETDEGTIQIGEADVPEGVDSAFPLPDDFDVQLSSDAGDQFGFSGVTALSIDELITFYTDGLAAAGYEIVESQEIEGVLAVYSFESADVEGQVAISDAPGGEGSSVLVTIGVGSDAFSIDFGGLSDE